MNETRKWAIEQAIALHGKHGSSTEVILREAEKLLAFIAPPAIDKPSGPPSPGV